VNKRKLFTTCKLILVLSTFTSNSVAFAAGYYNMVALWRAQAITLDGTTSLFGGNGNAFITLATPAGTQAGDLLFACMEKDGGAAAIIAPGGWTQVGSAVTDAGNAGTLYMYTKIATYSDASGGGNYTWTWGGATWASIGMFALRGASTVDTWVSSTGSNDGGTLTTGSLTAAQTSEPLIAVIHNNSGSNLVASAPLIGDFAPAGSGFFGGHYIQPAQGASTTFSVTGAANAAWQTVLVAFRH
jgi:hypothetical protein